MGGAELIAHYQAKLLKQRGNAIIVLAGEKSSRAERYSLRQDDYEGLPVFRTCLRPQDYQLDKVNFFHSRIERHFTTLLEAFSPDVVHMHNISGLSAGIIDAAKRRGIKTVLTLHDHWGFCYKNTLMKRGSEICRDYTRCAECLPFVSDEAGRQIPIRMRQDFLKLQLSSVDAFISPSLYMAEAYLRAGVPLDKLHVIWNGVDLARFSSVTKKSSHGTVRFTYIGYFGVHKGVDLVVDALHLLPRSCKVSMNLVGEGDLTDHIRGRVRATGLGSIVKFWGRLEHARIEEVFEETDVLILPSIWPENQPVSITEAMAARTPVIASAIGGIPELVIDGHNGYLFQPGSAQDLARKMREFVANPDNLASFGENGFKRIRNKSFEKQLEKICRVYE